MIPFRRLALAITESSEACEGDRMVDKMRCKSTQLRMTVKGVARASAKIMKSMMNTVKTHGGALGKHTTQSVMNKVKELPNLLVSVVFQSRDCYNADEVEQSEDVEV